MSDTPQPPDRYPTTSAPLMLVSSDTHIGPTLEQLRPYCPKKYRDQFDEFATAYHQGAEERAKATDELQESRARQTELHMKTAGHYDMQARLRDLDRDGVAGEVIFHGSANGEPIPFVDPLEALNFTEFNPSDAELTALGYHIYNQWLADAVSIQPERHVGLAYIPIWDVEAAVRELEWAREVGLRSVNFPAPRPGIREYDDPAWEPFWSACEALEMPLTTHGGAVVPGLFGANKDLKDMSELPPHAVNLIQIEAGGWPSRRAIGRMVFGGVFERHPRLKLVLTEQDGGWWNYTLREMDSSWHENYSNVCRQVPREPSYYISSSVFIGASFIAPFEAEQAVNDRYAENILWGSDYPHVEGTWAPPDAEYEEPRTHLALRYAFSGLPAEAVRLMAGENAARVYGLDAEKLTSIAARINAPSFDTVSIPIDAIPDSYSLAFRQIGPWA